MAVRILPVLLLLLLVSCEGGLTVDTYAELLAARLEAASLGEKTDAVLRDVDVEKEDYERFERDVFADRDPAARVLENLRRDHPELFPPADDK